jgi:hypothetical protein
MITPEILNYIRAEHQKGTPEQVIRDKFLSGGRSKEEVDEMMLRASSKGSSFGVVTIVTILFILLGGGAGAYAYFRASGSPRPVNQQQKNVTATTSVDQIEEKDIPIQQASQEQEATQKDNQIYTHPRGFFTFSYPQGWEAFISKSEDTSLGDITLVPERNVSSITYKYPKTAGKEYPTLPKDTSVIDEYVVVGGYADYSLEQDRSRYAIQFSEFMAKVEAHLKMAADTSSVEMKQIQYADAPAFIIQYEQNGKQYFSFSAIARGTPSPETAPIIVTFYYVANKDIYDQKVADLLLKTFSENVLKSIQEH